jgi:hypothetical protein
VETLRALLRQQHQLFAQRLRDQEGVSGGRHERAEAALETLQQRLGSSHAKVEKTLAEWWLLQWLHAYDARAHASCCVRIHTRARSAVRCGAVQCSAVQCAVPALAEAHGWAR